MKLMKIQILEYTCLFVIRLHIKSRLPANLSLPYTSVSKEYEFRILYSGVDFIVL